MVLGTYANLNTVDNIGLAKLDYPSMKLEKNIVCDDVIKEVRREQQTQEDLNNMVERLDLISELQKQHQKEQQHFVEQRKKFLEEMKQRKDQEQVEMDKAIQEKLRAVKEIQEIARKAIESLVDEPKLLEVKIVSNEEDKPKLVNLNVNPSVPAPNVSKANPPPLSYQLGLNVAANDSLTNKSVLKNEKSATTEDLRRERCPTKNCNHPYLGSYEREQFCKKAKILTCASFLPWGLFLLNSTYVSRGNRFDIFLILIKYKRLDNYKPEMCDLF
ncbi:hypothetical protein Trydic_g14831 [Trypoxylus dichotomus]